MAILAILIFLPFTPAPISENSAFWKRVFRLDWIGAFLSVSMVTMLLLSLQWAGNVRPWNDPGVIVTLVLVRNFTSCPKASKCHFPVVWRPSFRTDCVGKIARR